MLYEKIILINYVSKHQNMITELLVINEIIAPSNIFKLFN